ncbi:MAG: hypothetical protein U0S76_11605 [Pseudoxanthomonas sp.]|nr:hypothetical protein [Pseudoxanthomonas sp.]
MSRVSRLPLFALLLGLLALAGCNREGSAPAEPAARPSPTLPTSQEDGEWRQYISRMVGHHVRVRRGVPPFAVYLSPADDDETRMRTIDNANQTLQRGVLKDTVLAFGSRDSALMARHMPEIFEGLPENRLKGARVVFVGRAEDRAAAEAAIAGSGAEFIFLEFGS